MDAATFPARAATPRTPRLDGPWATALFAAVVAVLTWDSLPIAPGLGIDPSWMLGLNLAAAAGLDHGTEVVFTYGPLGFLELPQVADGLLATLSAIYLLATRAALAASLLWAARRSLPWLPAAALAVAVAVIAPRATASVPLALATLWCLLALQEARSGRARHLLVFGGGALAALEVMVKLNVGLTILIIVAVAALALPGRLRNLAAMLAVFAAVFAALWAASGQGLANIDDYLRSSFWVVSGYSEAMQLQAPEVGWDWLAALLLALATLGAAAYAGARLPRPARVAILVVVGVVVFSLWKFGFVRHDGGHAGAFFEGISVVWVGLVWRDRARLAPVAATAAIAALLFAVAGGAADFAIRPADGVSDLRTLLLPGERADERERARAAMQAAYALDPRVVERIGDAPVDARPWEIGLLWAHHLAYAPLPVLQDYQAYDPRLDRLNADALASEAAPRFVLRHLGYAGRSVVGIDGRFTSFDSPLATRELLCRYRPALSSGDYQLLELAGANRCGETRPLETVTAELGDPVTIPRARADEAVLVSIDGAAAAGIERLRSFLYRAAIRRVRLGEGRAIFPGRNSGGPLLVSAPARVDFPAPFALAPKVETIAVESEGGFAAGDGPLRFEFRALAAEPAR